MEAEKGHEEVWDGEQEAPPTPPGPGGDTPVTDAVRPEPTVPGWSEKDKPPAKPKGKNRPAKQSRALVKKGEEPGHRTFTPEQKLLVLDVWAKSELDGTEFSSLVGVKTNTLYLWRRKFQTEGPEGLFGKPRGAPKGSRMDRVTRRAVLMIKESHPEYGCERISMLLSRGPGLGASPGAILNLLKEEVK